MQCQQQCEQQNDGKEDNCEITKDSLNRHSIVVSNFWNYYIIHGDSTPRFSHCKSNSSPKNKLICHFLIVPFQSRLYSLFALCSNLDCFQMFHIFFRKHIPTNICALCFNLSSGDFFLASLHSGSQPRTRKALKWIWVSATRDSTGSARRGMLG